MKELPKTYSIAETASRPCNVILSELLLVVERLTKPTTLYCRHCNLPVPSCYCEYSQIRTLLSQLREAQEQAAKTQAIPLNDVCTHGPKKPLLNRKPQKIGRD
jgi:hypothetical protein